MLMHVIKSKIVNEPSKVSYDRNKREHLLVAFLENEIERINVSISVSSTHKFQ